MIREVNSLWLKFNDDRSNLSKANIRLISGSNSLYANLSMNACFKMLSWLTLKSTLFFDEDTLKHRLSLKKVLCCSSVK